MAPCSIVPPTQIVQDGAFAIPSEKLHHQPLTSKASVPSPTSPRPSATDLTGLPGTAGTVVIGYRGTFAFGRDGMADVCFRKLTRILVHGKVSKPMGPMGTLQQGVVIIKVHPESSGSSMLMAFSAPHPIHPQVNLCREVFGDTLNESRDPDRGGMDRYSSRLFLKHTSLEQAFDMLLDQGFILAGSCASATSSSASGNAVLQPLSPDRARAYFIRYPIICWTSRWWSESPPCSPSLSSQTVVVVVVLHHRASLVASQPLGAQSTAFGCLLHVCCLKSMDGFDHILLLLVAVSHSKALLVRAKLLHS